MPDAEKAEMFVGTTYQAIHCEGETGVEIQLDEIKRLPEIQIPDMGKEIKPFIFLFYGQGDEILPDAFYKLTPEQGESLLLFLSCKGPLEKGVLYESVIN